MLAAILLAVGVPSLAVAVSLGLRRRSAAAFADGRGIALQTVIIIVVLLVIAGGVATVLLTRGSDAISDLEEQEITRSANTFTNSALCEAAGHTWTPSGTSGSCGPKS